MRVYIGQSMIAISPSFSRRCVASVMLLRRVIPVILDSV